MKEILLIFLWFFSFLGFLWFFAEKFHLPGTCAPLVTICALTAVMYIGGMLHVMQIAAWIVLMAGAVLAVWMIVRRSRSLVQPGLLLFAAGCAALWMRYRSSLLVAYDDFSHWGMIVRHMLANHRLPGANDALITFQSYPPGAACWIYYVCRFLGNSDGMMLTAQAAMTLAGWLPLFSLAQGKGRLLKAVAAACVTVVGVSLFQGTASLMVDNLLAAIAVGAVCILIRDNTSVWLVGLMAAVLSLVKDSGLFFSGVLVLGYAFFHKPDGVKTWLLQLVKLGLPFALARIAWFLRVKLAFPAATVSRHALTIENLRATGSDKSYEDMFRIARLLMKRVFSPDNQALQILLLMMAVMIVAVVLRGLFSRRWNIRKELAVWCACALSYAVWVGFMGLMYVFSMTLSNALELVAFERYNSTCALFLYGMMVIWLCQTDLSAPRHAAACLALAALVPLGIGSWSSGLPRLWKENYFVPLRNHMEQLSQMYVPKEGESVAVVVSAEDDGVYADYMARYTFQLPNVKVISALSEAEAQVYYAACPLGDPLPQDARVVQLGE